MCALGTAWSVRPLYILFNYTVNFVSYICPTRPVPKPGFDFPTIKLARSLVRICLRFRESKHSSAYPACRRIHFDLRSCSLHIPAHIRMLTLHRESWRSIYQPLWLLNRLGLLSAQNCSQFRAQLSGLSTFLLIAVIIPGGGSAAAGSIEYSVYLPRI